MFFNEGICAFVPLENGLKVASTVQQLVSEVPLLKGVRRILDTKAPGSQSDDPCWFLKTGFAAGLQVLADHGLHFELLTRVPEQFDCALALVEKAPVNLTIVMQHLGGPNMSLPSEAAQWSKYVKAIALHNNVVVKISGVPERADAAGFDTWREAQVRFLVKSTPIASKNPYLSVLLRSLS
jgi:predicted TIM-barrel fold metal-dependent hydrolase